MERVARIKDLTKYYGKGENKVEALRGVNLEVFKGEFVAIVGASGSGKSTLLNMMGGLDVPTSGMVEIEGQLLNSMNEEQLTVFRRRKIGFVFQQFNLIPVLSVYENIILPVQLDNAMHDETYIERVLNLLGITEKRDCLPSQLSGGQQQRVAIARALITKPSIILADEPTGNLDSETTKQVMRLLKESANELNQTIIMITHNEALTNQCGRIYHMMDGVLSAIELGA